MIYPLTLKLITCGAVAQYYIIPIKDDERTKVMVSLLITLSAATPIVVAPQL